MDRETPGHCPGSFPERTTEEKRDASSFPFRRALAREPVVRRPSSSAGQLGGSQSNDGRPVPDRSVPVLLYRRELLLPIRAARSGRHRPARSPAGAGSYNGSDRSGDGRLIADNGSARSGPIRPTRSGWTGSPVDGPRSHVRMPTMRYAPWPTLATRRRPAYPRSRQAAVPSKIRPEGSGTSATRMMGLLSNGLGSPGKDMVLAT